MIGAQLLLAAVVFASPIASPEPLPVPGCIKGRGTDEDAVNVCCLKLKRDAETSAHVAGASSAAYERAMAVREKLGDLVAREAIPGCIKERGTDEDAVNICCLKLKRDAEASAHAAASAFASYGEMLAYRAV